MKTISFPFSGGSKFSFRKISQDISNFVVLEYSGRGMRIKEKKIVDIELLIEDLLPKVIEEIKSCKEYIIYGHSMGALVGYLICQKLQELDIRQPLKLVVSGLKTPSIKREKVLSHLADNLFWEEVVKLGGISDELKNHPDLMNFYIPILKADFTAIENYQYIKKGKLTIPIDVFYGSEEAIENEIIDWIEETTAQVTINKMEGNHFFIFDHVDFFSNYFKNMEETINL